MKYIERLKKEHPECVSDEFCCGCDGCPQDYGYEPDSNECPQGLEHLSIEEGCRKCWEREMPEEKPENSNWIEKMLRKFDRRD